MPVLPSALFSNGETLREETVPNEEAMQMKEETVPAPKRRLAVAVFSVASIVGVLAFVFLSSDSVSSNNVHEYHAKLSSYDKNEMEAELEYRNRLSKGAPLEASDPFKPPTFCARDPPAKDDHHGFTCMEHKCWPQNKTQHDGSVKLPSCAAANGLADPWGTDFFKCMCLCCAIPCKQPETCATDYYHGAPDFALRWPWHPAPESLSLSKKPVSSARSHS